jgi:hypothetical protein
MNLNLITFIFYDKKLNNQVKDSDKLIKILNLVFYLKKHVKE